MKIVLIICSAIILSSCKSNGSSNLALQKDTTKTMISKEDSIDFELKQSLLLENFLVNSKSINNDFVIITHNCGIFISPNSIDIEKMKKEYGEEDFYTVADDNMYYDNEASKFLDSVQYKCIYPKARYLKFTVNNETICIDTKSRFKSGWLRILYSVNNKPIIFNSIDIEQVFHDYAKKNMK